MDSKDLQAEWLSVLRKYTRASKDRNDYMTAWQKVQLAAKTQHGEGERGGQSQRAGVAALAFMVRECRAFSRE